MSKCLYKPPALLKPEIALLATDQAGIAITNPSHICSPSTYIFDSINFINVLFIKDDLQRTKTPIFRKANINYHIFLFSLSFHSNAPYPEQK